MKSIIDDLDDYISIMDPEQSSTVQLLIRVKDELIALKESSEKLELNAQTLTLQAYIREHGVHKAAELLGQPVKAVWDWRNLDRCPRPETAFKIVAATKGVVSYEGIYIPFALRKMKEVCND